MYSILFIDDEQPLHDVLSLVFRREGYEFVSATSAPEGTALADRRRFDLIIVDMMMPGCDGVECVRQLRASGQNQPIFLMTGADPGEYETTAGAAGVTGIIPKPCRTELLLATIKRALAGDRNHAGN